MAKRGRKPKAYWEALYAAERALEDFDSGAGVPHGKKPKQQPITTLAQITSPTMTPTAPMPERTNPKRAEEGKQFLWNHLSAEISAERAITEKDIHGAVCHTQRCCDMTTIEIERLMNLFQKWNALLFAFIGEETSGESFTAMRTVEKKKTEGVEAEKVQSHDEEDRAAKSLESEGSEALEGTEQSTKSAEENLTKTTANRDDCIRFGDVTFPSETYERFESLHFQLRKLCLRWLPVTFDTTLPWMDSDRANMTLMKYFTDLRKCVEIFQYCLFTKALHTSGKDIADHMQQVANAKDIWSMDASKRSTAIGANGHLVDTKAKTAESDKSILEIFGEKSFRDVRHSLALFHWKPPKSVFEAFTSAIFTAENQSYADGIASLIDDGEDGEERRAQAENTAKAKAIEAKSKIVLFPLSVTEIIGYAVHWHNFIECGVPVALRGYIPSNAEMMQKLYATSIESTIFYLVGRVHADKVLEGNAPQFFDLGDILPQHIAMQCVGGDRDLAMAHEQAKKKVAKYLAL